MQNKNRKLILTALLGLAVGLAIRPSSLEAAARKRYCEQDYCSNYTFCRTTTDLKGCDHTGLPCTTYECTEE